MDEVAFKPDLEKQIDQGCEKKMQKNIAGRRASISKGTEVESQKIKSVWFENTDV